MPCCGDMSILIDTSRSAIVARRFAFLAVMSMAMVACEGGATHNTVQRPEERDSAGVRWVVDRHESGRDVAKWRVGAEPVLRIGAMQGDLPYLFAGIAGVTRLSDGRIVVLDGMSHELRAFSATGAHLWTAGGHGDGPGEFRSPMSLRRMPGDVLLVEDGPTRIRFNIDGEVIEHLTLDWDRITELGAYTLDCRIGPRFIGEQVLLSGRPCGVSASSRVAPSDVGHRNHETTLIIVPWTAERADTIGTFHIDELWVHSHRGGPMVLSIPLGRRGIFATGGAPTKMAYASSDRYRIDVYDIGEARHVLRIDRPAGMQPPGTDELDAALKKWDLQVEVRRQGADRFSGGGGGMLARQLQDVKRSLPIPDSISDVERLFVDDLNHVWVGHRMVKEATSRSWVVYSDDGTLRGEIALPSEVFIYEIGKDYILGVTLDADSVPYVVLLSLHRNEV